MGLLSLADVSNRFYRFKCGRAGVAILQLQLLDLLVRQPEHNVEGANARKVGNEALQQRELGQAIVRLSQLMHCHATSPLQGPMVSSERVQLSQA